MSRSNISLKVQVAPGAFWNPPDFLALAEHADVVDASFVDDEAIVLLAKSPALLDRAIHITLSTVFRLFGVIYLDIYFSSGKT